MKKILSNKSHQGTLTIIIFLVILEAWHQNLKKLAQLFQVSTQVHPLPPITSDGQEIVSIPQYNLE